MRSAGRPDCRHQVSRRFREALKAVIGELKAWAILFIDEIHTVTAPERPGQGHGRPTSSRRSPAASCAASARPPKNHRGIFEKDHAHAVSRRST
jgi:ATP-dependent Clp protease ATP-binding subunit ClpA